MISKEVRRVIVIGAGGHAAELQDYLCQYNQVKGAPLTYELLGFLDDNSEAYQRYQFNAPLLGGVKSHQITSNAYYLMGIANLSFRKSIIDTFEAEGARFIGFVHPTAMVSLSAQVDATALIAPFVNLGPNTIIGEHTLLNSRCSIGHDSIVGKYNFFSPNVCLSGHSLVGDENLFGINSATTPGVMIGSKNKIMAGMTVDKHIGDNEVIFYRYKERLIARS